jgi:hypothetical protein
MTATKILSSQSLFKEIEALITVGYKSLTSQTTKLKYYKSQKVISLYDKIDKTMLSADIKAEIISQIEGQTGLKLSGKNERQLKMIADNNDDLKEIIITFKAESSKATYKLKTIKNAIYLIMALRCHN